MAREYYFHINGLGSVRTNDAPKNTKVAYKLMRLMDGELYPLFIDSSMPVPVGVWLDADSPNLDYLRPLESNRYYLFDNNNNVLKSGNKKPSKKDVLNATKDGTRYMFIEETELKQKRFGENRKYWNVGINGSGSVSLFSMRPGWHAGSLPTMRQIGKGKKKDLRDDSFVWTEIEISADIDYTEEANKNPDKDLPDRIPVDGYYMKATNADKSKSQADLVGWYVAGAIKINRIIGDKEAREIIDKYNASHTSSKKVLYDYERESGKMFDAQKMALYGINSIKTTDGKPMSRIIETQIGKDYYKVRKNKSYKEGENWLFVGSYPTGYVYADRRWEEASAGGSGWDYLKICIQFHDDKSVDVYNSSLPEYKQLIAELGGSVKEAGMFPNAIEALLDNGEKIDANKLKKVATQFGITNPNDIIQQAELGVVRSARKIAQSGESLRVRFEKIRDIYDLQPTISPKDGTARFLQQFSTPAPIAFLAGEFVKGATGTLPHQDKYLEPSAGNGMLTIALPKDKTYVNELDEVRYKNLLTQGFAKVGKGDAANMIANPNFRGVITNPPFANLEKKDFLRRKGKKGEKDIEYTFEKLDHKLAIMALESMADNGRCAIIVGGKLASKMYDHKSAFWKNERLFGEFNVFVSYINRQYNLIDILYISGDLYAKQGTTYPIVMLLIDGRKEWDAEPTAIWHKYDEKLDKPIESQSEYWDRMIGHIEKQETKQAPVQSSLVSFGKEVTKNYYYGNVTNKDILFKDEPFGTAVLQDNGYVYYVNADLLYRLVNGKQARSKDLLYDWSVSLKKDVENLFVTNVTGLTKDGLHFVFNNEKEVVSFFEYITSKPSSDLDRKRKLLILAKAKIKIAQAKNGKIAKCLDGADDDTIKSIENIHKASFAINRWLNENKNGHFNIELPSYVESKISKLIGRNIDVHSIDSNGIRHSIKNHGVKGRKITTKDIPISNEYYMLIPYIMVCPDAIEKGSDDNNRESIRFIKNVSNGVLLVVEKESKNNSDKFETVNMWGKLSDVVNAKSPNIHVRNVTISTSDIAKIIKDAEEAIIKDKKI